MFCPLMFIFYLLNDWISICCSPKILLPDIYIFFEIHTWNFFTNQKESDEKRRVCGKCIVGQSSAKFGKVDMFSKEAIKKQSWQSWCIFLFIIEYIMHSKVGEVEILIHYSRQSWQSWDITFLIMGDVQTQGRVSKVETIFGLFCFF